MSLSTGIANLNETRKSVLARWDELTRVWDDPNARRFQEQVIEKLDQDLKQSLEAMAQMQVTQQRAQRDCSETV